MRKRSAVLCFFALTAAAAAQHHGGRSSPATAPPPAAAAPPPVAAVSSGLGPIQFTQVDYGVPAPQTLTRQLRFDDDRTRASALSAVGVPAEYLTHGRIPYPHSLDLTLVPLGLNDDLDALLTVELDNHIVTAVLVPVEGNWRRIATLTFATAYSDVTTTPTTWLRTARSLIQRDRYRAVFHGSSGSLGGAYFSEYEASLRVFNNRAVITASFESTSRECTQGASSAPSLASSEHAQPLALKPAVHSGCDLTARWFQSDPLDPWKRFTLVTGTGHLTRSEAGAPYMSARTQQLSHLRTFTCQPYVFSDSTEHFEPTGPVSECRAK